MKMSMTAATICTLLLVLIVPVEAQQPTAWKDRSPHASRFIPVGQDVRLEVLDWGGSGRPLVLLAGGGNTAHVFDDFAPKLTDAFHVYGITRRGFGESGFALLTSGADTFADDVLAVLDALEIERPVLVGNSIGRTGVELDRPPALFIVSSQRPGRWTERSTDPQIRAQVEGINALLERQAKAIEAALPSARVAKLAHANHYVFLSNEADVLREMRAFLGRLR